MKLSRKILFTSNFCLWTSLLLRTPMLVFQYTLDTQINYESSKCTHFWICSSPHITMCLLIASHFDIHFLKLGIYISIFIFLLVLFLFLYNLWIILSIYFDWWINHILCLKRHRSFLFCRNWFCWNYQLDAISAFPLQHVSVKAYERNC